MKSPITTYLNLALEAAKRILREGGVPKPTEARAAVLIFNELLSRFSLAEREDLKRAVFGLTPEQMQ